jgi:hypothetical protein
VSSAGTMPRGDSRPGEARPPRRLVLLSESAGLAAVLTRLLDRRDQLTRSDWSREVAEQGGFGNADLVVLDVPRAGRAAAFQQLRRRYRGPVVVFVERGDNGRGLPADEARTLLARPFSTDELTAALGLPELGAGGVRGALGRSPDGTGRRPAVTRPTRPTAVPAANAAPPAPKVSPPGATDAPATLAGKAPTLVAPKAGTGGVVSMFPSGGDDRAGKRAGAVVDGKAMVDGKAAARQAPPRPGAQPGAVPPETPRSNRLGSLFAGLVHGWRARRTVRIAGFASLAAVAFMVAFALAAQGRCGPGCDALTGFISPASTFPAADSPAAPTTSVRKSPPSTTSPPPGSGFQGVPGGVLGSTTSTTRRATTTTRRPSATTRPTTPTSAPTTATTLPPTTATTLPPTTATTAGP